MKKHDHPTRIHTLSVYNERAKSVSQRTYTLVSPSLSLPFPLSQSIMESMIMLMLILIHKKPIPPHQVPKQKQVKFK